MRHRCFVAGPYNAPTRRDRLRNIAIADVAAQKLFALNYLPVAPHKLFGITWEGVVDEEWIRTACLDYIPICHLVCVMPGWEHSTGTQNEIACPEENGLPVYFGVESVPPALLFERDATSRAIGLLLARRRKGVETYGGPLRKHNGRNNLQDATEEAADLLCYLINELE